MICIVSFVSHLFQPPFFYTHYSHNIHISSTVISMLSVLFFASNVLWESLAYGILKLQISCISLELLTYYWKEWIKYHEAVQRFSVLCCRFCLSCSCAPGSASPSGASDGAETPNNIFHELTLNSAVTEGQVSVLDAAAAGSSMCGRRSCSQRTAATPTMRQSRVGIYDVDAQKSLAVWEPRRPATTSAGPCWMEMPPFSPSR